MLKKLPDEQNIIIPILETECKCRKCLNNDLKNGHWCKFKGNDPFGRREPSKCMVK